MSAPAEPAFAWYRLAPREAAALAVLLAIVVALSAAALFQEKAAPAPSPESVELPPAKVHVNRAGVAELCALPGIGPRKAEKILEARKSSPIRSPEELARAAGGIPQASLERMTPYLDFEP